MGRVNRSEFRRRLIRLRDAINYFLETGNEWNLFPFLFQVYSYMWCKSHKELIK